jgi:hypothetical protein
MSQDSGIGDRKQAGRGHGLLWGTLGAACASFMIVAIWRSPPYSFHPTCTYTVNASVTADVEIRGQELSSTVVYQDSRTRQWIAMLNSAGCKQSYGNALTYKLADDRILLIPTQICHSGAKILDESGRLDVLDFCRGRQAFQDSAFIIDSASKPQNWYPVRNGVDFRIRSMTAVSTRSQPTDDMASIAPNLLKADFKYPRQQWSRSPEKIIPFHRRYDERRNKPDQAYEFEVRYSGPPGG